MPLYENPMQYAVALESAPACHKAATVAAYPLATAALMGVLVQLNLSTNPGPIRTPDDWAAHYAARLTWVSASLYNMQANPHETAAPANAPALLECWLAQNPAVHLAQFIETLADALITGDDLTGLDAPAHIIAAFDTAYLQYMADDWDESELVEIETA